MGQFDLLYPLYMLFPVLGAVAYWDLKFMKIPNALSLIALAVFALGSALFLELNDILWRLAAGGAAFALCILLYGFRLMGGGDAKFLPALILFIPLSALPLFVAMLALTTLLGALVMMLARRLGAQGQSSWASVQPGARYPFGLSIGLAGVGFPVGLALLVGAAPPV